MFARIPFLRFALAMIAGVLLEIYIPYLLHWELYLFSALVSFYLLFNVFAKREIKNLFKPYLGFISILVFFFFGILIARQKNIFNSEDHLTKLNEKIDFYSGYIISEIEEKKNTIKFEIELEKILSDGKWKSAEGKIVVYIYKMGYSGNIKYGDELLLMGSPEYISPPLNPGEFNLKNYYLFHGISHRHFISPSSVKVINSRPGNQLIAYSIYIRQQADMIFRKYIHSERERNIASALILGIKGDIDDEIEKAYASTGTIHVLAVSGLHVGVIYKIMQWLLFFFARIKHGKKIRAVLLILFLWLYAFVTGLCPSVLRAVAMFSFIIIAEASGKRSSIFNVLALSCILLLSYDPYFLMEVGFQLSFLAVGGIIYLQPKIYNLFEVKNGIVNWLWEVTSVSLAAQIATFPLGMLYFHQFPNYFLLSNLFVIPAAVAIMGAGLLFVAFSFWEWLATWLGFAIEWSVWALNWLILFIEDLPYSTWLGISITVLEAWLIYASIFVYILMIVRRKYKYLILLASLVAIFSMYQLVEIYVHSKQQRLIVYHVNGGSAIDMIEGFHSKMIAKQEIYSNDQKMLFHVLNHRWERGVNRTDLFENAKDLGFGKLFVWNKISVLLIDGKFPEFKQVKPDIVVIQNNSVSNLEVLTKYISFNKLIVDGSNNHKTIDRLKEKAKQIGIDLYLTSEKGAFYIDL